MVLLRWVGSMKCFAYEDHTSTVVRGGRPSVSRKTTWRRNWESRLCRRPAYAELGRYLWYEGPANPPGGSALVAPCARRMDSPAIPPPSTTIAAPVIHSDSSEAR